MSDTAHKLKSETLVPQNGNGVCRPKNWLEPAVLVMLQEANLHGYKLMEELTVLGFEATNPGTMYRTLRRMEENGALTSKWETSGDGPARRMYYVTEAGEAYLDLWANSLKQYQQVMDTFLEFYTDGSRRKGEEKQQS